MQFSRIAPSPGNGHPAAGKAKSAFFFRSNPGMNKAKYKAGKNIIFLLDFAFFRVFPKMFYSKAEYFFIPLWNNMRFTQRFLVKIYMEITCTVVLH